MSDLKLRRAAVVELAKGWRGPAPAAAAPAKKRLAIDALVQWAYLRELPKAASAPAGPAGVREGWGKVAEWAEELSLAGLDDNRFGVVPDWTAGGLPHADAVDVHDAMLRLDDEFREIKTPADWNPLGDLALSEAQAARAIGAGLEMATRVTPDGRRVLRVSPRAIVFRAALLGPPDWRIDAPEERVMCWANGRPRWFVRETVFETAISGEEVSREIETEGLDARGFPKAGAYRKTYLEPDPAPGVASRAEWEVWIAALDALREMLAGRLSAHEPEPCALPARPWETGLPPAGRVWRARERESDLIGRETATPGGA